MNVLSILCGGLISVRIFSIRKFVQIYSFLFLASICTSSVGFADEKEEYLTRVTHRLTVEIEEVFYRFSDHVMRKYCSSQYEEMMDYVSTIYQDNLRISLSHLINRKEELMSGLLDECENKSRVIALEYRYNEVMSTQAAELIERIKNLLDYEDEHQSLTSRLILADQIVDVVLVQDFNEKKILEQLELNEDQSDSAVRLKYLQATTSTVTLDFDAMIALEQAAEAEAKKQEVKKTQKKNRCAVCSKKLGLMPFECPCHLEFCAEHRLPESHHCTFDHKTASRERLRQSMPVVVNDKVKNRI